MNVEKFNQIFGKKLSGEEIKSFNIHNLSLNSLIANTVYENEFDKINFILDEKVIAQKTKERLPELYNSDNKLNDNYLKSFLNQQQLKIEDIVQIINFETREEYFKESFFKISYPLFFTNKISNYDNHKRNILLINFEIDKVTIDEIYNESVDNNFIELEKFYNENISNYMSLEKRDVEYIVFDKNLIKERFNPLISEVQKYYNDNKELFLEEETRSFLQFNFKNKNFANIFLDDTKNLNTEETIKYAIDNNFKYNEFQNLKYSEILEQLSSPLFELEIDERSQIIETSLANHILILKSIKKENQLNFQDAKDKITSTIVNIDSNEFFKDLLNQVSDEILEGENIKSIANKFDLKLNEINNLSNEFENLQKINKVLLSNIKQNAFISNKDFVNDIINISDDLSYIFNVTEINTPKPLQLESIKDEVFLDLKFDKKYKKIVSEIEKNKDDIELIKNLSNKYDTETKKIVVNQNSTEIPNQLIDKIFKSQINLNLNYVDQKNIYVVRVEKVIIDNKPDKDFSIQLEDNFKASFGEELIKNKKIKINEALLNALIERY